MLARDAVNAKSFEGICRNKKTVTEHVDNDEIVGILEIDLSVVVEHWLLVGDGLPCQLVSYTHREARTTPE